MTQIAGLAHATLEQVAHPLLGEERVHGRPEPVAERVRPYRATIGARHPQAGKGDRHIRGCASRTGDKLVRLFQRGRPVRDDDVDQYLAEREHRAGLDHMG